MDRLTERLAAATNALLSLEELVILPSPSKVERDAAIQRFEYTCEATWKAVELGLREAEGIRSTSPKSIARGAHRAGLLDASSTSLALAMVDDRNQTVHTYNEAVAQAIHGRLPAYASLLRLWLEACARWTV